jgi:DNA-directed RNA polymerase specialized sigma24 family protein
MTSLLSSEALDAVSRRAASPADLRDAQRSQARLLLDRSQYLPEADRRLLRLALRYRLSVRELAELARCNHGSIVRRLRRIRQRLCEPFVGVLVDPACPLPTLDRELALERYLRGRSLRTIAKLHGISVREVRRRVLWVKGWAMGRREGVRLARAVLKR